MKRKHNSSGGLLQLPILNFVVPAKRHQNSPPIIEEQQDNGTTYDQGDINRTNPYKDIDLTEFKDNQQVFKSTITTMLQRANDFRDEQ
ncbi:hypothetical protein FACUT_13991 [Fusarium acutatum]|uniref:Uncharacterized protein n=1 Tax=Fusarium acutatum TaxID=78861 RepID=A0A8H4NHD1_9HYPO|nr:hypothetical protein FACUT_13991 [Fusarium acutatum]